MVGSSPEAAYQMENPTARDPLLSLAHAHGPIPLPTFFPDATRGGRQIDRTPPI